MHDDHDEGLAADLRTLASRRRALLMLGAAGLGAAGWWASARAQTVSGTAADGSVCVVPARETAGPYPADGTNARAGQTVNALAAEGIERRDLRPSFAGLSSTAEGVATEIEIRLVDTANACAPLAGRAVYLWHCDAQGRYSLYDLPEANYLRGLAVADAEGVVRFTTAFPGCYRERWPHLHFEVFASAEAAVSGRDALLTSQFALSRGACEAVYAADPAYAESVANLGGQSLEADMIFRDNSAEQNAVMLLAVSGDVASGLAARATVGV
jgi:protocatechuate 3,4-dioxygenase beta subunit